MCVCVCVCVSELHGACHTEREGCFATMDIMIHSIKTRWIRVHSLSIAMNVVCTVHGCVCVCVCVCMDVCVCVCVCVCMDVCVCVCT